jgi:hypothetical protein
MQMSLSEMKFLKFTKTVPADKLEDELQTIEKLIKDIPGARIFIEEQS